MIHAQAGLSAPERLARAPEPPAAIEAPTGGRVIPRFARRRSRPAGRRPVPGRPLPAEGPRLSPGGRSHARGHGIPEADRLGRGGGHLARAPLPRGWFRIPREDEHARARDPSDHRVHGLRAGSQPVGHHALDRRLEWRLGCGSGGRHGLDRPRERRRWLDPESGVRRAAGTARSPRAAGLDERPEWGDFISGLVTEGW